ncbi:hypothetical protein [Aureivirga sp. CE67]|uniref:hypothetical protein n=1 Tax=Aureivirga sp. CE67 TaxID=1788983 RepID=UPI0018CB1AB8|nr:hypothetical protein [Aureivirga sp. CE67]
MKNVLKITIVGLISLFVNALNAQSTPIPPTPPTPPNSTHHSSSSSVSRTTSSSNGEKNVDISIHNSDDRYKVRATFSKNMTENVQEKIQEVFGKTSKKVWTKKKDGELIYKITLSKGRLNATLYKDLANDNLILEFEDLFQDIRDYLSND